MTSYPTARLCYVTQPEPGTLVLNLQFDRDATRVIEGMSDGAHLERIQISREQLANIIKDGVGVLG
jgi:hypothetical protein